MKTDQIADLCGVDAKTLRKYFSRELDNAAMLLEAQAVQVLVHKMRAGNVSAAKAVREIAAAQAAVRTRAAQQKQPRPEMPGKKQQLAAEAKAPPQGWGDLLN